MAMITYYLTKVRVIMNYTRLNFANIRYFDLCEDISGSQVEGLLTQVFGNSVSSKSETIKTIG